MCRQLLEGPLSQDDRCNAYNPQRWRRLADLCIQQGRIDVAQQCAQSAGDLALSLLLISCTGDKPGLYAIAKQAEAQNQMNIAFLALYIAATPRRVCRCCSAAIVSPKPPSSLCRTFLRT